MRLDQLALRHLVHGAVLVLLIAGATARVVCQQPANATLPFVDGEQLFYEAEFNRWLLRNIDVGELRFHARVHQSSNGADKPTVTLVGDALSKGFMMRLAGSRFHLHVESIALSDPFAVVRTKAKYEDKRATINSEAVYDHSAGKAVWTVHSENREPSANTLTFTEPVHDVLTLIYFVRSRDLRAGQQIEASMIDNARAYRCLVNVMPGKKISTAIGRVNTLRLEPSILDGNREVRPRGTLAIWVTDDARHIPVKAQVKSQIGTIDIKLKRISYRADNLAQKSVTQ